MLRINYLLGLPTFLVIIGLAWASQSHAYIDWEPAYNEYDDLPEVQSLLPPAESQSSFALDADERVGSTAHSANAAENQNVLDLVKQIDAMQREVQELRGLVDVQTNDLKNLKSQNAALQKANNVNANAATNSSLNSNSGLELNTQGVTYQPK